MLRDFQIEFEVVERDYGFMVMPQGHSSSLQFPMNEYDTVFITEIDEVFDTWFFHKTEEEAIAMMDAIAMKVN